MRTGIVALAAGMLLSGQACAAPLHGTFVLPPEALKVTPPKDAPSCDAPPAPLVRLETVSKYRQDDPSRSKIDPVGEKRFREDIAPMERMTKKSVRYANRYLLSKGKKINPARCALAWLDSWAGGGALAEIHNDKSYNTVGKYLGGMALAYLQIMDAPGLDAQAKQRVTAWLARIAADLAQFHDDTPDSTASRNNHRYWSGLGVAAAGIAANRRDLFDWGMEAARVGLRQIGPDGTLPLELDRNDRARDYHLYALTPLVMLAELGKANGVNLYAEEDGALHRLAALVLLTTDDASFFEKKTGKTQKPYPDKDTRASRLIWMEPYNARFPDPRMEALLKDVRPLSSTYLGGALSELYAKRGE